MHILTLCKRKFWMATSYRKRNLEITNGRFQYKAAANNYLINLPLRPKAAGLYSLLKFQLPSESGRSTKSVELPLSAKSGHFLI